MCNICNLDLVIDKSQKLISEKLKSQYYLDDIRWGNTCFSLPIFKFNSTNPHNCICVYECNFYFDSDVEFYGDLDTQYNNWLQDTLDELKYRKLIN